MRIVHVHTGLQPIPPPRWGAIERIIWAYHCGLQKLEHTSEIKYLDDVGTNEFDVNHIHIANLALKAYEKNIPYTFTFHDHQAFIYGKDSKTYKDNLEAIDKSIISFVPAKYLIEYFENRPNLFYFPHGIDRNEFYYKGYKRKDNKLLCVANNGICGNPSIDRKGFLPSIEAARKLDLPITIAGPTEHNKEFFKHNPVNYGKLDIIYDPSHEDLKELYNGHTIFLHPSSVEAGCPNLTLLEAAACGLPIVGTYEDDSFKGLTRCERDVDDIVKKVEYVLNNYDYCINQALKSAEEHDWYNIVPKLAEYYSRIDEYRMRKQLINVYETTDIKPQEHNTIGDNIHISFLNRPFVEILGNSDNKYKIEFWRQDINKITLQDDLKPNHWSISTTEYHAPFQIKVYNKDQLIRQETFGPTEQRILICLDSKSLGDTIAWFPFVEEYRKKWNAKVFCSTFWNDLFKTNYPNVHFIEPGQSVPNIYKQYNIGIFDPIPNLNKNRKDPRLCSLQEVASDILGLKKQEIAPNVVIRKKQRPIKDPYVCISTASTAQAKLWNYQGGWQEIIDYLNNLGYKVAVVQKEDTDLKNVLRPKNPSDIHETIQWLYNCEFYIGLTSGLSWLTFAVGKTKYANNAI